MRRKNKKNKEVDFNKVLLYTLNVENSVFKINKQEEKCKDYI